MRPGIVPVAVLAIAVSIPIAGATLTQPASPQAAVDDLLAADRAFSAAAAKTDVVTGLTAMFAPDVIMPTAANVFADGRDKAAEALRANPDNSKSRVEWAPVRGGISADGQHGFTFGFMTLHRPDGTTVPIKYLSYWIKSRDGWRVAGYKRRPRPVGDVTTTPMAPAMPAQLIAPITDASAIAKHRSSLEEAERAFSRDAQTMGIGPAFEQYGSADAMNMGGPEDAGFVIGSATIGRNVGAGSPPNTSPVVWAPDHNAFVASSGDLGVTFGYIRAKANGPDGKPSAPSPFFTVWRRASATAPWKYVAE
ncbi:MAG TPA: DUF4440 domain-containing protein [Vicinamibacterales bacterium]|nr:DUF4440 domain-containing protein [Vicinamibacterales bacterium]